MLAFAMTKRRRPKMDPYQCSSLVMSMSEERREKTSEDQRSAGVRGPRPQREDSNYCSEVALSGSND